MNQGPGERYRGPLTTEDVMSRSRKPRGRPPRPLPPRIDATAEEVARVFLQARPPGPEMDPDQTYHCRNCKRSIYFPEILYNDGRCEKCHNAPAR